MSSRRIDPALLDLVRDKVSNGWTQGALARNRAGRACGINDPEAVAWCLQGAIHAVLRDRHPVAYTLLMDRLARQIPTGISLWNDRPERNRSDILEILDTLLEEWG